MPPTTTDQQTPPAPAPAAPEVPVTTAPPADPTTAAPVAPPAGTPAPAKSGMMKNKWVMIAVVVIVLALVVWFVTKK